jgi:GLPGLI family protein
MDLWEISKEKKVIGNYVCYKAITKKVTINSKGSFTRDIIAWFTTELPFYFGPKGYGGLPGLILELDDRVIKYTLHSINYVNNLKLSKPKDGKLVTKKEFRELY